jgi:outer membrane putative beta-barrel porin/alpha-amylase
LPYTVGNFRATVAGADAHLYRSGLVDARVRLSVNLRGGPALHLSEFPKWRERTVVGASLTVIAPTGQYDPARLINPGLHRWAIKPEVGFSRRWGRWTLDLYAGMWLYAANLEYFPGTSTRSQAPVGVGELHWAYQAKSRFWFSADGNFWTGGRTTIDGTKRFDLQRNSRIGVTVAIPVDSHQSVKFSYSRGAYIAVGGDYQNLSAAWQYSWIGKPR